MDQRFLRLHDTHKKYILQKKWTKTVNPALSSDSNILHPAIWGHHHQLDDQHRNPNINNKDHLVGQLTRGLLDSRTLAGVKIGDTGTDILENLADLSVLHCRHLIFVTFVIF